MPFFPFFIVLRLENNRYVKPLLEFETVSETSDHDFRVSNSSIIKIKKRFIKLFFLQTDVRNAFLVQVNPNR